jgi:hypothetical protein
VIGMKGYIEKPLTSEELLKVARILEGISYHLEIHSPPNFSHIRFYDQITQKDWGVISVPLYFAKDLEAVARHHIRFMRAYGVEIYKTEERERHKELEQFLEP